MTRIIDEHIHGTAGVSEAAHHRIHALRRGKVSGEYPDIHGMRRLDLLRKDLQAVHGARHQHEVILLGSQLPGKLGAKAGARARHKGRGLHTARLVASTEYREAMRVATWNVNSLRARVDRVVDWMVRADVDVLAMQEIKCTPEQLPAAPFIEAGYEIAAHGHNQWNGVAIASRVGLEDIQTEFPQQPSFGKGDTPAVVEARALGATCGGVRVWSLYVPNGRALGDPHYAYKLEFLHTLKDAAAGWADKPTALVGDFNVAPLATDIWDESDPEAATHVTAEARAALASLADAGFTELSRQFIPAERTYTFWDYKQLRFPRNEGMRIDFFWASPPLVLAANAARIEREERKGKGASDHVPVVVDFAL